MILAEHRFGVWRISVNDHVYPDVLLPEQVHGDAIVPFDAIVPGETEADGVLIDSDGSVAGIRTADCIPVVLITDSAALALHVSRKSLLAGLLDRVPRYLPVQDITRVWVGPHICDQHFTFEWEGREIALFRYLFPAAVAGDEVLHISLRNALLSYVRQWGVPLTAIVEDGRCTFECADLPSYRRWLGSNSHEATEFPRFFTLVERVEQS